MRGTISCTKVPESDCYSISVVLPMVEGFTCTHTRVRGDISSLTLLYEATEHQWFISYQATCIHLGTYIDDIASMFYFVFSSLYSHMTYSLTVTLRSDGSMTTVCSGFEMSVFKEGIHIL